MPLYYYRWKPWAVFVVSFNNTVLVFYTLMIFFHFAFTLNINNSILGLLIIMRWLFYVKHNVSAQLCVKRSHSSWIDKLFFFLKLSVWLKILILSMILVETIFLWLITLILIRAILIFSNYDKVQWQPSVVSRYHFVWAFYANSPAVP